MGRYLVLDVVGEGATARVYAAYDPVLDRKVALKLLHPLGDGPGNRDQLLLEAKALARVSHPNLVAVHDAGTHGDFVFLAMEFIDGQTLRRWVASKRTKAEVLDAFLQAGRGLSAVHEAGLVHRDFKPENVLVGSDGRVRVSDFGLARVASEMVPGALVGTPAYMAPEQLLGHAADARADQFAFCVALAEALSGARPFATNSVEQVSAGPQLSVSPRLTRVLQRGLSPEREARFPSMAALLTALEPRTFRASSFVVPAVALIAVLVAGGWVQQRAALCTNGPDRVAAVWSMSKRTELGAHFATLNGGGTFQRIATELDRWGAAWAVQHRETCEATRLRGEQSDHVLTARMACLDRRLVEAEAALGVLSSTTADSLARAQDAVLALTPLSVCTNTNALLAQVPRPEQPAMRARVEVVERALSSAQAFKGAGRFREGLPVATTAALEAQSIGWVPLEAEASFVRGQLLAGEGDFAAAEGALREGWPKAQAARDDRLATLVALEISAALSQLARMKEAQEWVWHASSLAMRIGPDWDLAAKVATQEGHLFYFRTEFAEAEARYRTAWELRRDHQGVAHPVTVTMLANLANAIGAQGRYELSAELLVDVARQLEVALGRSHHKVGQAWNAVSEKYAALGRSAEALAVIEDILPEQEQVLGASSHYVARLHLGRAEALRGLHRYDDALVEYHRALATFEQASMPLMVGVTLSAMGTTACNRRTYDEGMAFAARSLEVLAKAFGETHEEAIVAREVTGECLLDAGKPAEALQTFTRTLAAREAAEDDDWTSRSVLGLGRAHLALGRREEAKALVTRAVVSLEKSKIDATLLEEARSTLARLPAP